MVITFLLTKSYAGFRARLSVTVELPVGDSSLPHAANGSDPPK